jgi:hypothetical protein
MCPRPAKAAGTGVWDHDYQARTAQHGILPRTAGQSELWGQWIVYDPPLFNRLESPYCGASDGESMGVKATGR